MSRKLRRLLLLLLLPQLWLRCGVSPPCPMLAPWLLGLIPLLGLAETGTAAPVWLLLEMATLSGRDQVPGDAPPVEEVSSEAATAGLGD